MAAGLERPLGPNSVHLCIDMQRLFSREGPWPTPWLERLLPAVVEIAERAPHRTVFTRFIPPPEPDAMPGNWRHFYARWPQVTRRHLDPHMLDLMPGLAELAPPATIIDRSFYSAFTGSSLHGDLRRGQIDTLLVTGAETDVCVLATSLSAVDLGYRVIIVSDAVCSSSDETHDALLTLYARRYSQQIELIEVEALLSSWPPAR
jgi:nicotinamidase-related amidase